MAPHDEEDDPAVYRSGSKKKKANGEHSGNGDTNGHAAPNGNGNGNGHSNADAMEEDDDDDDDDDSGTLLTVQPGFTSCCAAPGRRSRSCRCTPRRGSGCIQT